MPTQRAQSWEDCDPDIKQFVSDLVPKVQSCLQDALVGVYLHGSLTMGSYYRPKSDIDLFIVVIGPLSVETAKELGKLIARHSEHRPTTSTFELFVITAEAAKHPVLPLPYELEYSIGPHDKILRDEIDYSATHTEVDLICQLEYVLQHGICLYGKPIAEVFGAVQWADFMEATLTSFKYMLDDNQMLAFPINNVLNICRILQLLRLSGREVHNKDEGAAWGLQNLPVVYHPLIQQALEAYHSSKPVTREERKTGGIAWDSQQLLAFRDYAKPLILSANN